MVLKKYAGLSFLQTELYFRRVNVLKDRRLTPMHDWSQEHKHVHQSFAAWIWTHARSPIWLICGGPARNVYLEDIGLMPMKVLRAETTFSLLHGVSRSSVRE